MPLRNLVILFAAAVVSLLCYAEAGRNRYAGILSESIEKIATYYVEPVESRTLFEGGMKGMLTELDPYSGYIPPDDMREFQVDIEQEFGGIGIEVGMQDNRLTVLSPVPGTPAYDAGLLAGDTILAIDDQSTEGFSLEDAVKLMRGPKGTPVRVSVLHRGAEEAEEITIRRAKIRVESIRGDRRDEDSQWMFRLESDPRIGCIRLTSFGDHTAEDLHRTLKELQGKVKGQNQDTEKAPPIEALIMDLRGNAGGLLTSAIAACDMFIDENKTIVSTRGRRTKGSEYSSKTPPIVDPDLPTVVLVDRFSASASEIFAACLQDYNRGVVIGERTWGKGTVQNVIPIEGGRSAIRLTTQTYWRPSGRNIHRHPKATDEDEWGVQPLPEHVVKLSIDDYKKVFQQRRDRDAAAAAGPPDGGEEGEDEEEPFVDPQMQKAVEYLQQQLDSNAARLARLFRFSSAS